MVTKSGCECNPAYATTNTISCLSLTATVTWMEKDKQTHNRVKSHENETPSLSTKILLTALCEKSKKSQLAVQIAKQKIIIFRLAIE